MAVLSANRSPDKGTACYLWMVQRDAWGYAVSFVLGRGQPFLEALLLSAVLPAQDFGVWSWATALWGGVVALTHFGVPAAVFRYAALADTPKAVLFWYGLQQSVFSLLAGSGLLLILSQSVPTEVAHLCILFLPALAGQHASEVLRSFFRAGYENVRLSAWQAVQGFLSLGTVLMGAWWEGLTGAAWSKVLSPVWSLGLAFAFLKVPPFQKPKPQAGFWRFAWQAYLGNLALEAIFFLPGWLLGWRAQEPLLMAYWRWSTLIPLNLRQIASQVVLYLYPRWVQSSQTPFALYSQHRKGLWMSMGGLYAFAALWIFFWDIFPGKAYIEAQKPYGMALLVSFLWSVEANLLPNLLSALGHIGLYRAAYMGGLLAAIPFYFLAGRNLYGYLMGLAMAGLVSAGYAYRQLKRVEGLKRKAA